MSEELAESTLDQESMRSVIARAFRWAVKQCIEPTGLPEYPIVRRKPYEGEQELPLYIRYRDGGLYLKASVTMRITKARKVHDEPIDLDEAIAHLSASAADHCALYFALPGNTIGACNFPEEKSECFVGFFWRKHIVRMTFRVSTFVGEWREPDYPHDPMDPSFPI
ncbi:MAG: hypothetical protein K2Y22_06290 [Candidatus Obscuribacterales bacterium]|nr:hypothetical protein [Candidatus Obscuribacterales bacterium]